MDVMSAHSEADDPNGEGEGVWSPDIEQAFQEALKLFPPCGRRKHILQEEGGGKMYGRNELIARYIYQKTGHVRTRKQVSSHIQVLSRREARTKANSHRTDSDSVSPASSYTASSIGTGHLSRPDSATSGYNSANCNGISNGSSNGPVPMDTQNSNGLLSHHTQHNAHNNHSHHHPHYRLHHHHHHHHHHPYNLEHHQSLGNTLSNYSDFWEDRPIMTRKIRLVEFSAFIEQRKLTPLTNAHPDQSDALSQAAQAAMIASLTANASVTSNQNSSSDTTVSVGSNTFTSGPTAVPGYANITRTHTNLSEQYINGNQTSVFQQTNGAHHDDPSHHLLNQQNDLLHATTNHRHHTNSSTNEMCSIQQLASQSSSTTPPGFHRHSYVKIDFRKQSERQSNKMERIDIREIQDKFPDIGGPNGLFHRGASDAFFLVKFWADLDFDTDYGLYEDQNSYLGFSSHFETIVPYRDITCSTKACSYGNQIVEKVEKVYGAFNSVNNTYSYAINRSPMCEFMIQFIKKLRQLPELPLMNRILENFTVLQLVTSESTSEILLCIAYVFEIAPLKQSSSCGSHYHVYKLTKD